MVNGETIKSAIARKIVSSFKKTEGEVTYYPNVYKETILQDLKLPCFFIQILNVEQNKIMNNLYEQIYEMNVRYHVERENLKTYETLSAIGLKLFEYLSEIDVPIFSGEYKKGKPKYIDLPVRTTSLDFKITDNVLQVYPTYVIRVKDIDKNIDYMRSLEINEK